MEEETEKRVRWRLRFHAGEQVAGEKMTTTIAIGSCSGEVLGDWRNHASHLTSSRGLLKVFPKSSQCRKISV
ncbi:hypothetical protein DY000_02021947 [Brassica cretica]|uniref:Uncharacterized protein n=1 Tax=Brassica cretica TaxID=69181 RepID=A0ABQ7EEY6_BRACR|nr:hypothetical protein DY000_02021947 [Brassica cretica]